MSTDKTPSAGRMRGHSLPRDWDRRFWGVVFHAPKNSPFSWPRTRPMLLGDLWLAPGVERNFYAGEPTRALLFTTRKLARDWCRKQNAEWLVHGSLIVNNWRASVVRVRETVRVVAR